MAITGIQHMTDKQFQQMRTLIYTRSGIYFPDTKKYVLESRLTQRLIELELEDFEQYYMFLSTGPYQSDEFQEMFNRITINETSFFRNEPQLDVFEKQVLPELLEARKNTRRLRLWSAACSSGEEPYTLAILLHRTLGARLAEWNIEVLGTDISEKVLEVATSAEYSDYAVRTTPALVKQRYFTQEGGKWMLTPAIRNMVNFQLHNLKDKLGSRRFGTFDVIFCRNVLIYFDDPMKDAVVSTFFDQLAPDGTLFIGHSETIRGTSQFTPTNIAQGFCYRKTRPGVKAAA
ncbi:MAG: protein-glutamate O-methyltransferase CheR [Phycisphaerales bacterium]